MREIKFRAWDKKGREMWSISSIHYGSHDEILWVDLDKMNAYPLSEVDPAQVELMQYTGFKDKNGKEIYEGDLLSIGDAIDEVKWGRTEVYLEDVKEGITSMIPYNVNDIFEVVGNIYENPELLKERDGNE